MSDELFAHRLRRFRTDEGLSQEEMGAALGVTGRYIGMMERGDKEVEPSSAIAKLFALLETNKVRIDQVSKEGQQHNAAPESVAQAPGARGKLRTAREKKGLSIAQLAKAVGYTVGVYREIEEGRSQMGEKMIAKVAKVLGISPEELTNGGDHVTERGAIRGTFGSVPEIRMGPGMENSRAKFVPLLSMAQCGSMHAYDDQAYTHDGFIAFDSKDPHAFALTLAGDSMRPRFEPGDVAIVYPSRTPRNGDLVIARLTDDQGGDVMFKLYQAAGDQVKLSSYNPIYQPLEWHRSAFQWVYPVASVTKVFC